MSISRIIVSFWAYDLYRSLTIMVSDIRYHLAEWDLNPFSFYQKVVGYAHSIYATIAPMSISYQASHYCSAQGSHLEMSGDYFYLLVVCITPSNTVETSHWGWSFQVITSLFCTCFTIQVCLVFRNWDLLSSYEEEPKVLAYNVWGLWGLHWPTTLKEMTHS